MRSGRFVLLAGVVAIGAVTALAWARARRASLGTTPAPAPAAAPQPSPIAPRPATLPAPAALAPPPAGASRPARPAPAPIAQPQRGDEQAAAARIDALVRAGDIGRARDAAEEFLRRYPESGYCQHIETLTGVHPRPPLPGE
jgi:hypothetical protein